MAEIMREPEIIWQNETRYECFDDGHTLNDIARWMMQNPIDAAELRDALTEMLAARM